MGFLDSFSFWSSVVPFEGAAKRQGEEVTLGLPPQGDFLHLWHYYYWEPNSNCPTENTL